MSHDGIIEGSEQVTITVRDKNTGLILSKNPQQRNIDYRIKYGEGRILFNRTISSVSEDDRLTDSELLAGNPVYIDVDYESRLDSFEKTATGGRVRQQLGDHIAVGMTVVRDELSTGEYELEGMDAELRLGKNTRLVVEVAESTGVDSLKYISEDGGLTYTESTPNGAQEGSAWKVAAELDAGEWFNNPGRIQLGAYIKELDSGFISGGNFLEKGTRKFGLNSNLKITKHDTLLARYDNDKLIGTAVSLPGTLNETNSMTVQWTHMRNRWSLAAEYFAAESLDINGDTLNESSYGTARLSIDVTEKLKTSLEYQSTIKGVENDQTTLGLDYQLNKFLALRASGTDGTQGRAAEAGTVLSLNGGSAYLTKRIVDNESGKSSSTVLGAESKLGDSSRVYTEYQWVHSDAGKQDVSLVGAQRDWALNKGLNFSLSAEHSEIDSAPQKTQRYSLAAGLSYTNPKGVKASTKNEMRRTKGGEEQVQYVTSNHVEVKLSADFTFLANYRYSMTKDQLTDELKARFKEFGAGIAYRPVAHDWLNALGKYTHLSDQRPLNLGASEFSVTEADVASLEWSMELNRYMEWVGKEAMKVKTEETGDRPEIKTHTYLTIQRLNLHVTGRIDIGAEYRILKQREADDQREGWLSEVSWKAAKHLRLGVGYNFTDFSDNEFSDNNYSVEGGFVRVQSMF